MGITELLSLSILSLIVTKLLSISIVWLINAELLSMRILWLIVFIKELNFSRHFKLHVWERLNVYEDAINFLLNASGKHVREMYTPLYPTFIQ